MKLDRSQLVSWAKFAIGWPFSLVSILFIVKFISNKSSDLNISFSNVNYSFLSIGVLLFFFYFLMRSYLWRILISENGAKVSFGENTYRFAFSELKRFTPGNVWSFLSRATLFSEIGVDRRTIGASILADIQLVIIGCGVGSIFAIPWISSTKNLTPYLSSLLPISAALVATYFVIIAIVFKRKYDKNVSFFSSLWLPGFSLDSKIKATLIAVFTYLVYGLGNYFVLMSAIDVGFGNYLLLSSFFVFSLLVGYLTFITPMGLGVRELVVSFGLVNMMSAADAATISIFTRIILVISELAFLFIIFLWRKSMKSK